jgi:hypothetical protein
MKFEFGATMRKSIRDAGHDDGAGADRVFSMLFAMDIEI